ncbi:MAG: glycosyltransferase [Bacteroidales bacterium]|nr:glycosyltransferase [Bacteroidales bacterium]
MSYFELISFSIFLPYIAVILSFTVGFLRLKTFSSSEKKSTANNIKLSVLIPFKNEEMNLPVIYNNIKKQTLNKDFFEVLFINDHSEDASEFIIKDLIKYETNFYLITSQQDKTGKKQALKTGINEARNNLIVTSDADCYHPNTWLETISIYYSEHHAKLIISPVIMNGVGFFGKLQALEFLSLTASTAGAAGLNKAIMCNGANLAFSKSVFNEFEDALNINEISGDDVFLLHSVKKKYPKDIHYLKSNDAKVTTDSEQSLKYFFRQRIRWASKSSSYRDFDTITISLIIFITNLLLVLSSIILILIPEKILFISSLFIGKMIIDSVLLISAANYFKQIKLLFFIPILSIIYPFYIVITAFSGLLTKQIKWK